MAIQSWVQAATAVRARVPTAREAGVTSLTAVTSWLSSWCVCAVPATEVQTHARHQILPAPPRLAHVLFILRQAPGAKSALRVISGTLWCPEAAAYPASATTTLTRTTLGHVTLRQAPASGACTTPRAMPASTAKRVTTATLPLKAVGVSITLALPVDD